MQITIPLKALSVNDAWRGRRFKTKEYKNFEIDVCHVLPPCILEQDKKEVVVHWDFYIKNYGNSDSGNMLKPIEDVLVKRGYLKDDRYTKRNIVTKYRAKDYSEEKIVVTIEPWQEPD